MVEVFGFLQENTNKEGDRADWRKTSLGIKRVKASGFYEEKGLFRKEKIYQGRPIIGRDKRINGGVYLGGGAREAIVVDDQKDQVLERVYQALIERRKKAVEAGESFKQSLLSEVWHLVNQVMPYDAEHVEQIVGSLPEPDTKIYLSAFIKGGVCRHQALLTAYLLEKLGDEGLVGGEVSIDRNYVEDMGGHAWVRYTNSGGDVFILDSAQDYIGRLDEMTEDELRWFYERPEDSDPKKKFFAKLKKAMFGS